MFYLTMHSTHFIYPLYGIGYVVKDYLGNKRQSPLQPLHGLLFAISSTESFKWITAQIGQVYTKTFGTPIVEQWLEWVIAQWVWNTDVIREKPAAILLWAFSFFVTWDLSYTSSYRDDNTYCFRYSS